MRIPGVKHMLMFMLNTVYIPYATHVGRRSCNLRIVAFTTSLVAFVVFYYCYCRADTNVKSLLAENNTVLKLLRSEILQTEIRVLYDLMYVLNNSFRGNKTFKGLQQVMGCNRVHLFPVLYLYTQQ